MSDGDETAPPVANELAQAEQALDDARKGYRAGISDAAVINRLYYAAFHAVQAALYSRGLNPTSHGGVLSLFGSEIIAAGDAPRKDGRFVNELSELRQQADYGYGDLNEDVEALISRTARLVAAMNALCSNAE